MHDPATSEIWQTALGKILGGQRKAIIKQDKKGKIQFL
jgi:hypothetical protein